MNNILISIIVPVYNLQGYIERTLDSIFKQTYKNIEVIAVNDGSKDKTAKILDDYSKKEERLFVIHKENDGVTKARLAGIKVARGEYIGFVDGDDLIDADMFERLLNNAVKYKADISHCGYRMIKGSKISYFYNTGKIKQQNHREGIIDLLEGKYIEPGLCNKLYKLKLFSNFFFDNTLFDDSLIINEDFLMNYFLFKASELSIFEDFCPYQYIKREGSASQNNIRLCNFEHPIKVRQIIMNDCADTEFEDIARLTYVSIVLHEIRKTYEKKDDAFKKLNSEMIKVIKENKKTIKRLSIKQRISAILLIYFPFIYSIVNKFYNLLISN